MTPFFKDVAQTYGEYSLVWDNYDNTGWNPLHIAASAGANACASRLINHDIDVTTKTPQGWTYEDIAHRLGYDQFITDVKEALRERLERALAVKDGHKLEY